MNLENWQMHLMKWLNGLQYFENSNLNKLMFEKSRAEAVINSLKDASIGIDKNNIVLFANHRHSIIGIADLKI